MITVNISDADVAVAAPIIPNFGISKIFDIVLNIAQYMEVLNEVSNFPMLANTVPMDTQGEKIE